MGLAHTFMAAQALEDAAKAAGYDQIKIETQGADGIENRLTAQDIAEADIIIHSVAITPEDNERLKAATYMKSLCKTPLKCGWDPA